jgi:hypothetical protein
MVKNRTIQIRLTKDELETIKNNAKRKGFYSLSGFLRHLAIDHDFITHQKIHEIHKQILAQAMPAQNKSKFKKKVPQCDLPRFM